MRFLFAVLMAGLAGGAVQVGAAQAATSPAQSAPAPASTPSSAAAPAAPAAAPVTASSLLKPALRAAQDTLTGLKLDKWKKGTVRDEAGANVGSLLHDLDANIPPLLATADEDPGSLSRSIPLVKHLDAFYDVLLRVEQASRVSAPTEQIDALAEALLEVNKARLALDDQLAALAAGQEKQMAQLQATVRAQSQPAPVTKAAPAEPVPCKPAAPARKKKRTTPAANSTTPAAPAPGPK